MTRERRRYPRIEQLFEVRYRFAGELGASWGTASLINLGAGGMRIRNAEAIAPETLLDVEIRLPTHQTVLVLQGRVVWDRLQAAEVLEHGIEFIELKPDQQAQIDDLVQFLRKSPPGHPLGPV